MRAAVTALVAATRATLSLTPVILGLWLAGLVVARLVAAPWAEAFERFVAPSPEARVWITHWQPSIVDEFLAAESAGIEAGSDALRRAALPWIVAWTVLSGGVVAAVAPGEARGFVRDALRLAHRYLWLTVCTLVVVVAVGWLGARLDAALTATGLLDPERDRTWILVVAGGKTALQLVLLHVALTIHRLARVRVAVLDERFAPRSWLATARAFAARAPQLLTVSLIATLPLGAALGWAWHTAADTSRGATWVTHAPFVAVVAALVFRVALEARMWPLYGPAWRHVSPSAGHRLPAAAACVVLVAPALLGDAPPRRITRGEVLADTVVAETYVELDARAATSTVAFALDGDATVVSARIAEAPPDVAHPPGVTDTPSLPLAHEEATAIVTLPAPVAAGQRVALSVTVTSPRASPSGVRDHGAEILDAIGVRPADDARFARPRHTQIVVWSPEDLLVEATGGADVVGTDGAGRARAAFTSVGVEPVRAVALPRAVARSSTSASRPRTTTVVAAPGVLRTHRAAIADAADHVLGELELSGHGYPHDQLTLVLDPTPDPPRVHGTTWCVVPVSAVRASDAAWIEPLVTRLGALTGATSPKLSSAIASELVARTELAPTTADALRAVLAAAVASGAWTLDVPFTGRAFGPLDACGWWRSPYLPAVPAHAAPLAVPWPLDDTLAAQRGSHITSWAKAFAGWDGARAAIVDARTTGGHGAWTHTVVVERTSASIAPDVELLLSDGTERIHAWPDEAGDRWRLEVDGPAPLVASTLRFDSPDARLAQPWHDDARLATPDHGAADALTHAATRWNELALWGWAALF